MKRIDLTGQKFGFYTVIKFGCYNRKHQKTYWLCRCICGTEKLAYSQHLKSGLTQSCGCYHKLQTSRAKKTHGMSGTRIHWVWQAMKDRCSNPKNSQFRYYGGRGIQVSKRWLKFENFLKDMDMPKKGMTLDRIDYDKGYSKNNCRWATIAQQSENKRNNTLLTFQGKTHSLTKWSRRVGISRGGIIARLKRGWSVEKALTTPPR